MQLPRDTNDPRSQRLALEQIVRQFDNYGKFTLLAGTTTTTVVNGKVNSGSVIVLQPLTANAGLAYTTTFPAAGNGQIVITHQNTTATDRTFSYAIFGI